MQRRSCVRSVPGFVFRTPRVLIYEASAAREAFLGGLGQDPYLVGREALAYHGGLGQAYNVA